MRKFYNLVDLIERNPRWNQEKKIQKHDLQIITIKYIGGLNSFKSYTCDKDTFRPFKLQENIAFFLLPLMFQCQALALNIFLMPLQMQLTLHLENPRLKERDL